MDYSLPDFQRIWSNFLAGLPLFFSLPGRKGVDTLGELRASYTLRHPVHVKIDCGFGNWVYSSAPTITQKRSKKDVVAVARISDHSALPSSARSEASISFQIQCCKIWKGRRSCARFYNLKSPWTHSSFDMQNIPAYRWPPTHRLLAARFLANLEQLQNRDFSNSKRSKPTRVLTRTKSD